MTTPRPVTISTTFDLNQVRPKIPRHCSNEQFDIFCEAFLHVNAGGADLIPLHAAIRECLHRYTRSGIACLEAIQEELSCIAQSAHLLTGPQLARGRLTSGWTAYVEQTHPEHDIDFRTSLDPIWLEVFINACFGEEPDNYAGLLFNPEELSFIENPRKQLDFIHAWGLNIIHIGEEEAIMHNRPAPQCEAILSYVPRPNVKLICRMPQHENAELVFCIMPSGVAGVFDIELEWESGCNHPLLDFTIPYLINDAYRHDECLAIIQGHKDTLYRLNIEARGIAA